MNLRDRRDRLLTSYDRGIMTESEVKTGFVALLLDSEDDDAALELCKFLPDWFRVSFRNWLSDVTDRDFAYCWYRMGDTRTPEQVDADTKRHQEILARLAPSLFGFL